MEMRDGSLQSPGPSAPARSPLILYWRKGGEPDKPMMSPASLAFNHLLDRCAIGLEDSVDFTASNFTAANSTPDACTNVLPDPALKSRMA